MSGVSQSLTPSLSRSVFLQLYWSDDLLRPGVLIIVTLPWQDFSTFLNPRQQTPVLDSYHGHLKTTIHTIQVTFLGVCTHDHQNQRNYLLTPQAVLRKGCPRKPKRAHMTNNADVLLTFSNLLHTDSSHDSLGVHPIFGSCQRICPLAFLPNKLNATKDEFRSHGPKAVVH